MITSKHTSTRVRTEGNIAYPSHILRLIILVVAATLATGYSYSAVFNGDFETGAAAFIDWPGFVGGANPIEIPGWTGTGGRGLNPVFPGGPTDAPFRDNGGNFTTIAFLYGQATLQQDISGFSIGSTYVLNLDYNAWDDSRDFPIFSVFLDEVLLASSADYFPAPGEVIPVGGENPWYRMAVEFEAADSSITLRFASAPALDATLLLDNISIAAVPEPVSGLPVLLSLFLFAIWRTLARFPRMIPSSHRPVPAGRIRVAPRQPAAKKTSPRLQLPSVDSHVRE